MTGPMPTPFEHGVDRVRRGERGTQEVAAEVAAELADELTDRELLGLLDGDTGFLAGVREIGRNGYNHRPIVAGAVERLGIPGIRFTDGPRGVVMGRSTSFPVAIARGATWDPELEREVGRAIGAEGRAQGANLFAGVCVNLLRHPAWGRAQETYGDDPVHLGRMGAALTEGVRIHLMACVKHFALNSMENARFQVDVTVDDDVLHEVYLPHFRRVVEAGVDAVMSGYNSVNGTWCGDHPELLTEILRDEWGFDGFVMSDFVFGHRDPVGSVAAGLDLEMPFVQQRAAALPKALADGSLRRSDALRSARRLIGAQLRWAASVASEPPPLDVVASDDHRRLARVVAARSMVLLRNEPVGAQPVLPIDVASVRRLAVIGALASTRNLGDRGSSNVRPPSTTTILEGLQDRFGSAGCEVDVDAGHDLASAVETARDADVAVVVVGYTPDDEGEALLTMDRATMALLPSPVGSRLGSKLISGAMGLLTRRRSAAGGDRRRLGLHDHDEELISAVVEVNPRTVVLVVAGSAVLTESWRHRVPAVLQVWYPGMEGGAAVADVLTGEAEPGGRLPFAVPTDETQLPSFDHDARSIRYDRWWGQRRFDRDARTVAYPLGFGLGYTTFDIVDLELRAVDVAALTAEVSVGLRNDGPRSGATVVQVYASGQVGQDRPARQLVGFARVELDPGEQAEVDVAVDLRPLARRDAATRRWSVVGGPYVLEASRFSGDPDAATATLTIDA